MKIFAIIMIGLGCLLFALGLSIQTKQHKITKIENQVKKGNRGTSVAVGATSGAIVGGTAGASIGSIGIAACGTGVGIPVGVVCLITAGICAVVGGGIGAAVSNPDTQIEVPVVEMVNAYSPVEYLTVLVVGAILILGGLYLLLKHSNNNKLTVS